LYADLHQRIFYRVQLRWLNHRFNLLHLAFLPSAALLKL
jgi:hypothetical protein